MKKKKIEKKKIKENNKGTPKMNDLVLKN